MWLSLSVDPFSWKNPSVDISRTAISHPYLPEDAQIASYVPNTTSLPTLLLGFGALIAVFVASGLSVAKRVNPSLSKHDLVAVSWFSLCFFLHAFFEGYFVLYHNTLAGSQSLFAQLWKEYALSDSRYMTSDPFMLCIETLTVLVWAPVCLLVVVCIVSKDKMRYPLQVIMCVGHLFGVTLYYGTCSFEHRYMGVSHSRPEFQYYWVYYVGFNFPWVAIPAIYLVDSIRIISFAVQQLDSPVSATQPLLALEKETPAFRKVMKDADKVPKKLEHSVIDSLEKTDLSGTENRPKIQ